MTVLNTVATNESTYVLTCTFTDADGTAVTPNSLTWSLTDGSGNIINSREDVSVTPSSEISVVLSDDDLSLEDGLSRVFTIDGNYNSLEYGNSLPIRDQANFKIDSWVDIIPGA